MQLLRSQHIASLDWGPTKPFTRRHERCPVLLRIRHCAGPPPVSPGRLLLPLSVSIARKLVHLAGPASPATAIHRPSVGHRRPGGRKRHDHAPRADRHRPSRSVPDPHARRCDTAAARRADPFQRRCDRRRIRRPGQRGQVPTDLRPSRCPIKTSRDHTSELRGTDNPSMAQRALVAEAWVAAGRTC